MNHPFPTRASRDDPAFKLRLPQPLIEALDAAAKQNYRSRNSEIIARLAESITTEQRDTGESVAA